MVREEGMNKETEVTCLIFSVSIQRRFRKASMKENGTFLKWKQY